MNWGSGRYHWSNTALPAMFWKIPAAASLPWLLLLVFPRLYTLFIAIAFTVLLSVLQWAFKMTLKDAFRKMKVALTGRIKGTKKLI